MVVHTVRQQKGKGHQKVGSHLVHRREARGKGCTHGKGQRERDGERQREKVCTHGGKAEGKSLMFTGYMRQGKQT